MKRLTKRLEDGQAVMDCLTCHESGGCLSLYDCRNIIKDRLAAYEDTGLEPGEVRAQASLFEYITAECGPCEAVKSFESLRELAQADREGRVVVLPCKVGDTVYYVAKTKHGFRYVNYHPFRFVDFTWFYANFGKTVFLTREEAEKALEARKGAQA